MHHHFTDDQDLRDHARETRRDSCAVRAPLVLGGQGRTRDEIAGGIPFTGWLIAGCAIVSAICLRVIL